MSDCQHGIWIGDKCAECGASLSIRERVEASCEKCGGTDIGTAYHKQGCSTLGCTCTSCGYNVHNKRHDEHLHYTCRTCRFDWTGDVLARDTKEEKT